MHADFPEMALSHTPVQSAAVSNDKNHQIENCIDLNPKVALSKLETLYSPHTGHNFFPLYYNGFSSIPPEYDMPSIEEVAILLQRFLQHPTKSHCAKIPSSQAVTNWPSDTSKQGNLGTKVIKVPFCSC